MANLVALPRGEEAVYYDALRSGKLLYQHCSDCSAAVWYPRAVCPSCGSGRLEWRESARRGTVYSFTRLLRAGNPARAADVPYSVALVDLDEGIRVLGDLADEVADSPIGQRVHAAIRSMEDGLPTLVFAPERPAE
jgi:uncharacterized OB-fold protein